MREVRPPTVLGLQPSFGFGDRIGLATSGHVDALRARGTDIRPIFAQQSMREMARTRRKPINIIEDVVSALKHKSFTDTWSADADHLKTQEDVSATAGVGFTFFTIDPSDHVDPRADVYPADELDSRFHDLRDDVNWTDQYVGSTIRLNSQVSIEFDLNSVRRAAVKYGRAIAHAIKLAAHIDRVMGKQAKDYEIELSIDETDQPTSLAEHYIIAEQCLRANMKLVSLAPRYIGRWENAIDYRDDLEELQRSLHAHAEIARRLGPYKLSLHSGSDKLKIYELFAAETRGMFHVKTAGTSYLEAIRVAARHEPKLFRRIIDRARERFTEDKATYCVSAELDGAPTTAAIADDRTLEDYYLNQNDGRQILHVTYGSVLSDSALGPSLRDVLVAHPETHREVLAEHFGRHLRLLSKGLEKCS